jgi:hypothetical protein
MDSKFLLRIRRSKTEAPGEIRRRPMTRSHHPTRSLHRLPRPRSPALRSSNGRGHVVSAHPNPAKQTQPPALPGAPTFTIAPLFAFRQFPQDPFEPTATPALTPFPKIDNQQLTTDGVTPERTHQSHHCSKLPKTTHFLRAHHILSHSPSNQFDQNEPTATSPKNAVTPVPIIDRQQLTMDYSIPNKPTAPHALSSSSLASSPSSPQTPARRGRFSDHVPSSPNSQRYLHNTPLNQRYSYR